MVSSVASPGMKANPALYVLRERIRKGLQLYSSEPTELLGGEEQLVTFYAIWATFPGYTWIY